MHLLILYLVFIVLADEDVNEDEINVVPLDPDSAVDVINTDFSNFDVADIHSDVHDTQPPDLTDIRNFECDKPNTKRSHYVILFTYIPTTISANDLKYAINTVKMWSILNPNIQTVIYVPVNLNRTMTHRILEESCKSGIEVRIKNH